MRFVHAVGAVLVGALVFGAVPVPSAAQAAAVPPHTDVIVVGGTPAGVAAAVSAARHGAGVVLVERRDVLGGILSSAMMDQWDLNLAADGVPVQGGLFRDIYGRLGDSFTPADAARTFRDLAAGKPGIRVVTGAELTGVQTVRDATGTDVTALSFRRRPGDAFVLRAPLVIDATDDADVAALAGARYDVGRQDTGRDERMQPVTLMFALRGVDWPRLAAAYDVTRDGPGGTTERRAWGYLDDLRSYVPLEPDALVRDLNFGLEPNGEVTVNAIDILDVDGRRAGDLVRARREAEAEAPHLLAWLRGRVPGFADARIVRYADAVYVRETRHIAGIERLTADDVWAGRVPADTIGLSSYPMDLHPVTATERAAFAPVRHVYGIPFGALVPRDLDNMFVVGPAISASHLASGSARVIPTTIEEGEAAGTAAALALHAGDDAQSYARSRDDVIELRDALAQDGVLLVPPLAVSTTSDRGRMPAERT